MLAKQKMMGDLVLTTAMLDQILHYARCYSFRGRKSYHLKQSALYPQAYEGGRKEASGIQVKRHKE